MGDLYPDLEERIKKTGRDIYSALSGEVPSLFDKKRWMGRIMEWAMKDEVFKFQLFRYIDVLPSLSTDALVTRMLKEYFGEEIHIPPIIRRGIERLGRGAVGPYVAARVIRTAVESLARQFIAGKNQKDAVKALRSIWEKGCALSLDLLGEVIVSEKEAKQYGERYVSLLDFMKREVQGWKKIPVLERDDNGVIPHIDVSVKVSSLYCRLDPMDWEGSLAKTRENFRPLFKMAIQTGASVCLDMEHYYVKDLIIAAFQDILEEFPDYPFAGIALQAYLKDTKPDLLRLIEWAKARKRRITVRLVKGAYWDYETVINRQRGWPVPVFQSKEETDLSFEELTVILLENTEFIRPAIATHNLRSVSNAIAVAESRNLPAESFEFQMLYGMGGQMREVLTRMGYRVRVYSPVGELLAGMAYLVRRLLENSSNESFVRHFFSERRSFEELIKPPKRSTSTREERPPDNSSFHNEPPLDFSRAENRVKMRDALRKTRDGFNRRIPLYRGGEEVFTEKEIISVNPANPAEAIGRVSLALKEDAERALHEAGKEWQAWRKTSPGERAGYLLRAAKEMRKKRFDLAALEVFEVGKTWKDADGDVTEAIDYLEYYGREMVRLGTPLRFGDYPGETNEYFYEPKGIGLVIAPWNFPLAIPTGMVSAGIVTGNCVIFKPSGLSPVTGWNLVEAFRSAGLPAGVLQFLSGPGEEVGEYLVSHPEVDFIVFTGSRDVGLEIVRRAGETPPGQRHVKKVIAEMGGKNAIIVDETADLDEAVIGVMESAFGFQGQKCSACSRVIIIGPVFDEFCERLRWAIESVTLGAPEDPGMIMGPVVDEHALRKIQGYVRKAREDGTILLMKEAQAKGYFFGPVIALDVDPESPVAQEEIFGPVLAVMRAGDIGEALEIANRTPYALTGGIFSRSPANVRQAQEDFRVGNLYINRKITGALVGRQPFGGFGMSGIGSKAGGIDYLLQFMNPRTVSENTLRRGFAFPLIPQG